MADLPGAGDDSWAYGVCPHDGDALVVGLLTDGARTVPAGWRRTEGSWQHVPPSAWSTEGGSLSSCTSGEEGTVVQGTSAGRETLWSADGDTFTSRQLGQRGESFGRIRSVDGGFAAAGSRSTGSARGAVLWLSSDARTWTPVPVPSRRVLGGADVVQDGGSLLLAANSTTSPELWRLENPADLLQE